MMITYYSYQPTITMEATDQQNLRELFYSTINKIELDYSLYFGLKSIQKGLSHIESIYDHFKLDVETLEFGFKLESDLPEEIRSSVCHAYEDVFLAQKVG